MFIDCYVCGGLVGLSVGCFAAWICCVLLVDWCCVAVGWLVVGGLVVCYFLGC